jgi:hypothetical protein
MALRLPTTSTNTRRLERDSNAKLAATPHWCDTVMVRQAGIKSKDNLQETSIRLTNDQHQRKKSKPARRSTTSHCNHTYKDEASLKIPQSTFLTKEQLTLSQLD